MNRFTLLHPCFAALSGVIVYAIIYFLAPISPVESISPLTLVYIFCMYSCLVFGIFFHRALPKKMVVFDYVDDKDSAYVQVEKILKLSVFFSLIGVLLRLFDRFVLRSVSLSSNAFENRELLEATSSSIFSMLGGLLYPICFVSMYCFLMSRRSFRTISGFLVLVVFCYPIFDSLLFGSRSLILVTFCMFLIMLYSSGRLKLRLNKLALVFVLLFSLVCLSGYLFLLRLDMMGLSVSDSIYISGYATTVKPSDWISEQLSYDISFLNAILFSWLNFCQYYLHGIFEFDQLLEVKGLSSAYGAVQFNLLYKVANIFLPLPPLLEVIESASPRVGIFTGFFGPAHMDFSYLSLIYMFFLGVLLAYLYERLRSNDIVIAPLYFYFILIVFFMPVVNFIQSAQGLYIIISLMLFDFLFKSFCKGKL